MELGGRQRNTLLRRRQKYFEDYGRRYASLDIGSRSLEHGLCMTVPVPRESTSVWLGSRAILEQVWCLAGSKPTVKLYNALLTYMLAIIVQHVEFSDE